MTHFQRPGVQLTRRSVLELPALFGFAGLGPGSTRELGFEDFTAACAQLVQGHLAEEPKHPEALLLALAEAGARLAVPTLPRPNLGAFGGYEPKVYFGPVHRAAEFMVIEWKLEPGARLPAHNHTPVNVLSLCLEGDCWVEHFEIEGEPPAVGEAGTFAMRRTRAQLLRPGHATSLTPTRDNIHTFRAGPRGALGIDINVTVPGQGAWSMIEHAAKSDDLDALHEARWIGKPR